MKDTKNCSPALFTDQIAWGEALRWKDGYLYFSDIYGHKVFRADALGHKEVLLSLSDMPSGLGFLSDGSLLIVSGGKKEILRLKDGKESVYVAFTSAQGINDMVVDQHDNVYVGAYGYQIQFYKGGEAEGWVFHIGPNGQVAKTCLGLLSPNGMVVTSDGKKLIVADTFVNKLISFDLKDDGTPYNKKTFAELPGGPDGICLDSQGNLWAALPNLGQVACIEKDGKVHKKISFKDTPLCCVVGGEKMDRLFVVTVPAANQLSPDEISDFDKQRKKLASKIYSFSLSSI